MNNSTNFICKKLGNTLYKVSIQFSENSTERMDDKIMRLAKNDVVKLLESPAKCGTLELPQTEQLPERSLLK